MLNEAVRIAINSWDVLVLGTEARIMRVTMENNKARQNMKIEVEFFNSFHYL